MVITSSEKHLQARVELQEEVFAVVQGVQVLHRGGADIADTSGQSARAALHGCQHCWRGLSAQQGQAINACCKVPGRRHDGAQREKHRPAQQLLDDSGDQESKGRV